MAKGKLVNATQVFSAGRKDGFFYVESHLGVAASADGTPPFETYSKWSRFTFCNVLSGKTSVKANVKPSDIADVKARTAYAYTKHLEAESKADLAAAEAASGAKSPAYVTKLTTGNGLKGKTPAEILLGSPTGRNDLLRQREWLMQNMDRYERYNRPQVVAIDDAIALYDQGTLSLTEAAATSAPPIVLLKSDLQPQAAKRGADGLCPTYSIQITFTPGEKYPVTIDVTNFRAQVVTTSDGRLNVKAAEKVDEKKVSRNLTGGEWQACLAAIEANMREFEVVRAAEIFADARATDERMKRESGYDPSQRAGSNGYAANGQGATNGGYAAGGYDGYVYPSGEGGSNGYVQNQPAAANARYASYAGRRNDGYGYDGRPTATWTDGKAYGYGG